LHPGGCEGKLIAINLVIQQPARTIDIVVSDQKKRE